MKPAKLHLLLLAVLFGSTTFASEHSYYTGLLFGGETAERFSVRNKNLSSNFPTNSKLIFEEDDYRLGVFVGLAFPVLRIEAEFSKFRAKAEEVKLGKISAPITGNFNIRSLMGNVIFSLPSVFSVYFGGGIGDVHVNSTITGSVGTSVNNSVFGQQIIIGFQLNLGSFGILFDHRQAHTNRIKALNKSYAIYTTSVGFFVMLS